MAGVQSLAVEGEGVEDAVGVFSFLGDEFPAFLPSLQPVPGHGREGDLLAPESRQGFVGRIVQAQFAACQGLLAETLRGGQFPEAGGLQHLHGADGFPDEGFQPLLFQLVAGEGAVASFHEQLDLQAAVQGMGRLVHLSREKADEVHQALAQGDSHFLGALLLRERQAVAGQRHLFLGQKGIVHPILLPRLSFQSRR